MRIGFVGLGWAARGFHVPAAKRLREVQPVGGVDPSAEQRASWEKETSLPAYETLEELVAGGRPDVVVVATPPDSHADLCIRALEAGVHVVCEKPFVSDVEEADRVLAAAAAASRRVAVNHQYREKPVFRAIKERIGTADVGRLVFCQVSQFMDLAPWEEPVPWRRAMPNRTLFEGGVHLVDLVVHLFDELPEAVYARHSPGLDGERTADAIHLVTLEFPGGRLAQITINRLCRAGTRYIELRADCELASLRASHGGRVLLQAGMKRAERPAVRFVYGLGGVAWLERGTTRKSLARNPRNPGVAATATLFQKILDALERGEEPPSSGREARDVLTIIEAAYRSAATGERVRLQRASAAGAASQSPAPSGRPR
jgi:predicted dehydrogenase